MKAAGLGVDEEGPGQVEVSLKHGAKLLVNALGPPPPDVIQTAHDAAVLVGALVGAKQHAERQVAQGVDVIVAQGTEAGGHCGEIATMILVPEVVDAVGADVPVLAAHRDERDLLPRRRHGAHRCGRRTASPAKMAEVSVPGRARRATGPDVRAAGMAGADIVRAAQARVTSMATGTGLVTMSRTGE